MISLFNIYTSYFSHKFIKNYDNNIIRIPICATLTHSHLYNKWFKELAPDIETVARFNLVNTKTKGIKEWFSRKYIEKLNRLKQEGTIDLYIKELLELVQYEDVYLLCYEKPPNFCHRHILAKFLNKNYDLSIREY